MYFVKFWVNIDISASNLSILPFSVLSFYLDTLSRWSLIKIATDYNFSYKTSNF